MLRSDSFRNIFEELSQLSGVQMCSPKKRRMHMTKPQINVTPLIDVLLVLLIIFMVVTPMKPSAFDAKIPQPPDDNSDVRSHPDTLVVVVNRDSSLDLNHENLTASVDDPSKLVERLKNVFKLREENMAFADNHDSSAPQIQKTVF